MRAPLIIRVLSMCGEMAMVKMEIKKNVVNIFFLISIILLYIVFLLGDSGQVLPGNTSTTIIGAIWNKLHGNWEISSDSYYLVRMKRIWNDNAYLPILMPIICGLPSVINYMEEITANNKKLILVRSSVRKYYLAKIVSNMVSAALIALLAVSLYYITLIYFFDKLLITDDSFSIVYFIISGIFPDDVSDISMSPIYLRLMKGILYFVLYAIINGSFCLMVTAFCRDKYVTIGATIFFCYMQIRIVEELQRKFVIDGIKNAGMISDIINPIFLYFAGNSGFYKNRELIAVFAACLIIYFNYYVLIHFSKKQFDISEH